MSGADSENSDNDRNYKDQSHSAMIEDKPMLNTL